MKREASRDIKEKISNIKFHRIRPVGEELFHMHRRTGGRADRHDEAKSRFSQFYERA
jgi:hypothetical protein